MNSTSGRRPPQTMSLTVDELRAPEEVSAGLPFLRSEPASTSGGSIAPPSSYGSSAGAPTDPRLSHLPAPSAPARASFAPPSMSAQPMPPQWMPQPQPMPSQPMPSQPMPSQPMPALPLQSALSSFANQPTLQAAPRAPAPVAQASARAFSDEAAETQRRGSSRKGGKARYQLERRSLVERLGLDTGLGRRLRRTPEFAEILLEHRRRRSPLGALADETVSDAEREELDALTICSFAPTTTMRELRDAQLAALRADDRLEVPLGVVRGRITPTLDTVAGLQALGAMAQSVGQRDKRAQPIHAAVEDALAGLAVSSWRNVERLGSQLDALLLSLGLPAGYASEAVTRKLLEERAFRKKNLLGKVRLRAEIEIEGSSHVLYLPQAASESLPLLTNFSAVAIVELRPREDAAETATESLLGLAVMRTIGSSHGG